MALIAFDIDETLFNVKPGTDYENPASVAAGASVNAVSLARVLELASRGHKVAYVTGRCEHLRPITSEQLRAAGFPVGELVMNKAWQGYDAMSAYKADALFELQASLYIGDHAADRKAAQQASIPFIHVDEFRAGVLSAVTSDSQMISRPKATGG